MNHIKSVTVVILLFAITCLMNNQLYRIHRIQDDQSFSRLALVPGPVAKAVSLEFSGISSDILFLQTLSYLGAQLIARKTVSQEQYRLIYHAIKQTTYLDQRFLDPYVLAEMTLPFEAGMVEETNELLKRVIEVRKNDYRPFLFLWYNYYHFLQDPASGAKYLMQAATIPGAPSYFSNLAARSSFYGGQTEAGIIFLAEIINQTRDHNQKKYLNLRLEALKRIYFLEQKVLQFENQYGHLPKKLEELMDKKIIDKIPSDPYGGKFYVVPDGNGKVYSTSKLVLQGNTEKK